MGWLFFLLLFSCSPEQQQTTQTAAPKGQAVIVKMNDVNSDYIAADGSEDFQIEL